MFLVLEELKVLEVAEYKMKDKLYDYKQASVYLGISEQEFLTHTNEKATLCYQLLLGTRVYTQKELDRFKKEVLQGGRKL